jgi:hypothetical protein
MQRDPNRACGDAEAEPLGFEFGAQKIVFFS